jgi:hypothetical protein
MEVAFVSPMVFFAIAPALAKIPCSLPSLISRSADNDRPWRPHNC